MKSILSILATAALLAYSVSALQCPKGKGPNSAGTACVLCKPGYYNDQDAGECKPAQPGWYACGSGTPTCSGANKQSQCGKGFYSAAASSSCTTCPAGSICPSDTTDHPQLCSPGQYMPNKGSGANRCWSCPVGTYNNENGATACCKCCAGTFNDQVSQTHCFYCGEHTNAPVRLYSSPGATTSDACKRDPIPGITKAPKGTCDVTPPSTNAGAGQCPAEQGTSPSPGVISPKRRHIQCSPGFKKCPLYTGVGGFDCVDVKNDPEQCGGCLSIDGVPGAPVGDEGQDCTAIPNVSIVNCIKGKCIIETCRKGFTKSADGKSCETISGLKVQQERQNDSSKRNTPGRRWHVSHSEY